ncbi:unnamed protein product, partial [Effrenium voratum]
AQTRKRGAVLEVSPSVTLNAKLKAESDLEAVDQHADNGSPLDFHRLKTLWGRATGAMHGVLAVVENLNQRSNEIFDRLDAQVAQIDARLQSLELRCGSCAQRVEGARGSTEALKVQSARTFSGRQRPQIHTARLTLEEETLLSFRRTARPPEETGGVSVTSAAEDLARVLRTVAQHTASTPEVHSLKKTRDERLLPTAGRISSVSELFLLNSSEQPYKARHEVDNLVEPEDESFLEPRLQSPEAAQDTFVELGPVDLEEDEPDRATEDLRFRPRNSAAAEVSAGSEHRGGPKKGERGTQRRAFQQTCFNPQLCFKVLVDRFVQAVLTV